MSFDDYIAELRSELAHHSDAVRERLLRFVAAIPPNARSSRFIVFTSQDADGQFDVVGSVDGPDHFHINKAVQGVARIFDVVHSPDGFAPPVPTVDPFATDDCVNDVIIPCVADWLHDIWKTTPGIGAPVPIEIGGHDGISVTQPTTIYEPKTSG